MSNRKGIGGAATHTNPNCGCIACKARRRKAEAIALGAGDGGIALASKKTEEIVYVDDIPIITSPIGRADSARGNPARNRVGQWLALRTLNPELTQTKAAKMMGIHYKTLYRSINQAVKEGWLKFDDPLERIEHEIVPKTLDVISEALDEGDRKVAIEAAKGVIFPVYQESKNIGDGHRNILALKIEIAPGSDAAVQVGGNVFGKPKEIIDTYAIQIGEAAQVLMGETPRDRQEMDQEIRQQTFGRLEEDSEEVVS